MFFGVGFGWNHEEMESHGTLIKGRRKLVREKVLAMKELWTNDEAEFHGEYVNFEKSSMQKCGGACSSRSSGTSPASTPRI